VKARDIFRLSIQHDPERGYYIAAQVGSIRPGQAKDFLSNTQKSY
jgi:hypothetical protein